MKKALLPIILFCLATTNSFAQAPCSTNIVSGSNVQTVCQNEAISIITYSVSPSSTVTGLPEGVTYEPNASPNFPYISGTPTQSGVFTYTLTHSGVNCTSSSTTGTITVGIGVVTPGTDDQSVCIDEPITRIEYSYAGGGTPTVLGLPVGLSSSVNGTNDTLTINGTPTVEGTSTYTISTQGTCATSISLTGSITVGLAPVITINDVTICAGEAGTLTASGVDTYQWEGGGVSATGSSITQSPTSTTSYTVTGTSSGCSSSAVGTITVHPTLSTSNVTKTCNPNGVDYIVEFDITGGESASYVVTGDAGNLFGNHFTSTAIASGSNYSFTVDDAYGCSPISINGQMACGCIAEATISGGGTICSGSSATITVGLMGAAPWTLVYAIDGVEQTSISGIASSPYTFTTSTAGVYTLLSVEDANCVGSINGSSTVSISAAIAVSVSPNTSICAGSTGAVLTANGATSYSWSNGETTNSININPSSTTSYTVIGTSGGCTDSAFTNVFVTPQPSITVTSANICVGEAATLTAEGASSYTWSTGVTSSSMTDSPPGGMSTYTVTGTTSGCVGEAVGTIIVNPAPTITVNSPTICSGETTTLIANGANSYFWSSGDTGNQISTSPTTTETYSVTGTSGGCSSNSVATVTVLTQSCTPTNSSLNINVQSADISSAGVCDGSAIAVVTGGVAPYTITSGNNSVTDTVLTLDNLCEGFYTVDAIDANSNATSFTFVIGSPTTTVVNPQPTFVDSTVVDTLANNAFSDCDIDYDAINSITISDFSLIAFDTINVIWTVSHGTGTSTVTERYHFDMPGVYTLILDLFCSNRATGIAKGIDQLYISGTTDIETNEGLSVSVYPNPFSNQLTIVTDKNATVTITNVLGNSIISETINADNNTIETGNLNTGVYFVSITNANGTITKKLIKN